MAHRFEFVDIQTAVKQIYPVKSNESFHGVEWNKVPVVEL